MKRKIWLLATSLLMTVSFVGCSGENNSYTTNNLSYENSSSTLSSLYDEDYSDYSAKAKTIKNYCDADDCYKEGTKTMTGLSGATEYYCYEHYNEMQDIINSMEKDVGNSTLSKHQCEGCSKEGTHELIGLSGATEYYCTEHYNEIVEMLEMMLEDYN